MDAKKQFLAEMNCLLKENKAEIAIEQMNDSEYCSDKDVLKVLGNAHIRTADYDAASQIFSYLATLDIDEEDEKWIAFNVAVMLRLKDETDKAINILRKLLEKAQTDPSYICELGNCYFDKKEHDLAEECFHRAIENTNSTDKINTASIFSYSAWFFKETKRIQTAIKLFQKALSYSPLDKNYLLWLADCHFEISEYEKAKKIYEKARRYYPNDMMVQDYVVHKLEFLGDT